MKFDAKTLNFLDGCRWIFALFVVIHHTTSHYNWFKNMMQTPQSAVNYVWWFISHVQFAHFAVIGFFVISGFLVGGNALTAILKGEDFLKNYLINRVTRIYIVFIPALFLTFVLDTLGRTLFPHALYDMGILDGHFAIRLIGPELFQLQWIWSPYFGTNSPLWSLACEFWYYILFPLLFMPLNRALTPRRRLAFFLAGVALFAALSWPMTLFPFYFLIWMMGAFARIMPRPALRQPALALAVFIVSVVLTRLLVRDPMLKLAPELQELVDIVNAALFANLILVVRAEPRDWIAGLSGLNHRLAGFSYSLYAIHDPIIFFVTSIIRNRADEGWMPALEGTPAHAAAALTAVGTAALGAYGFSRVTEARTDDARRALRALIARLTAPATLPQPQPERAAARIANVDAA